MENEAQGGFPASHCDEQLADRTKAIEQPAETKAVTAPPKTKAVELDKIKVAE